MTTPSDDDTSRRVPTRLDEFGRPCEVLEVDEDAAGQWDARRWHAHPPL